ncbi:hypothetical protein Naga_101635g1 [Nannochloropsis gaditana]|uniref:Uncharacterized protein n=1 Tax=Nannochloropsis gaditana TaxID=72520 RepID=W7TL96_9STRA|nr:hypothetical protein Naga_101635g1 [Nannochloropsis gaditana]
MDNGYCQTQKETCDGRGEACGCHPTVADPVHCVLGIDIHGRRRRVFGQKIRGRREQERAHQYGGKFEEIGRGD